MASHSTSASSKHVLASAGGILEKRMEECGMWIAMGHVYALLDKKTGRLEEGGEERFEALGQTLAKRVW